MSANTYTSILRFFTRNAFRKDITAVVLLKLLLMVMLWTMFFSHPNHHITTPSHLAQHFLAGE